MRNTPTPSANAKPRRVLLIISGVLGIIIIAGSILAAQQAGFSIAGLSHALGQIISHIGGANLVVTSSATKLPADGQSQMTIEAKLVNTRTRVTAQIISGDGQIAQGDTQDDTTVFVYTAGQQTGQTTILIKAGALEEDVVVELVEPIQPGIPVITNPPDGSETNDPYPLVSGTGPAQNKITITNNGSVNTTTTADDQGHFQVKLERPLYNGKHTLAATATNDLGITSSPSHLITITVTTEPITLDIDHIRVVPDVITAGGSFAVFVPTSLNTNKVLVEIAGGTYELFDYNKSSVFMNTLPAPDQPGAYVGNIILIDIAGNSTRFEKLLRLSVTSSS